MVELLSSSQSDAATLIERLTGKNNQLKKQARLHKEPGNNTYSTCIISMTNRNSVIIQVWIKSYN